MENGYSSKWKGLWNRWSHFEQRYKGDYRHSLIEPAVTASVSARNEAFRKYRNNPNLVNAQPSSEEVESLFELGEIFRELEPGGIYPDVYAAACATKARWFVYPEDPHKPQNPLRKGFRGTRNEYWLLEPSIMRNLPGDPDKEVAECERRYKELAVFCEAMRQLRNKEGKDSSESVCMAIAQHYGIRSPLIDLTQNAWVALFFASHGAEQGDVGLVQCFFLEELEELFEANANFGSLQVIRADSVPRIHNQQGFFIALPAPYLDKQHVPASIRFRQHEGVLFEDDSLGVTESRIYPCVEEDPLAVFANPKLKTYPSFPRPRPVNPEAYFDLAMRIFTERDVALGDPYKRYVELTCEFHYRLQFVDGMRDVERSINRFKSAIEAIRNAQCRKDTLSFDEVVRAYGTHAAHETWPLIQNIADEVVSSNEQNDEEQ
ncbi:FRG domain-containing protein [Marinobacter fonticola]|uniref:FRG domain-containing protein n=1 Tax=Marinobacter fonticola TaxID=2603215 RepID=UPI0011E62E95|nr:FRG domain-containing protein [Marinobacter fonticola]